MSSVLEAFFALKVEKGDNGFQVADIPMSETHKIGRSKEGHPIFFIQNSSTSRSLIDRSLALVGIQYNRKCTLHCNGKLSEGRYTVVTLKSLSQEIQAYFIEIIFLAVCKLSPLPSTEEIQSQLESIIKLFSRFSGLPRKTIQGIWSEMVVIESASNVDYIVMAWHSSIYSKFDFNDGKDKIEVKSTLRDRRQHRFSLSQLLANPSSGLIIASLMTAETGIGSSIFDLREMILQKLSDKNLILRVDEMLALTLGKDIENAGELFFDLSMARDTLQYYSSDSIPAIRSVIPREISSVSFDCDLTGIDTIQVDMASKLLQSIIKK